MIPRPPECAYFFICKYVGYDTCPTECMRFTPVDEVNEYIEEDENFPWRKEKE